MAEWIHAQCGFFIVFLLIWLIATGVIVGLGQDEDFTKGAKLINEIFQTCCLCFLVGDFIAYGPVREMIAYFGEHRLLCLGIVGAIFVLAVALRVWERYLGSIAVVATVSTFLQATYQTDILTVLLIGAYFVGWAIIAGIERSIIRQIKIFDFNAWKEEIRSRKSS